MDRRALGRFGEWAALLLLLAKGYRPRHRNWRGAGGELDVVAAAEEDAGAGEAGSATAAMRPVWARYWQTAA